MKMSESLLNILAHNSSFDMVGQMVVQKYGYGKHPIFS